jgi:hypothetical protein
MIKHKKRTVAIVSALLFVFVLSACSNKAKNVVGKIENNETPVKEQTQPAYIEEDEAVNQEEEKSTDEIKGTDEVVEDTKEDPVEQPVEEAPQTSVEGTSEDTEKEKNEAPTENEAAEEEKRPAEAETQSRDDSYYVETVVDNFSKLYPSVVNRGDAKFDVLDTVILKDSKFYKEIKAEVQKFKNNKTKITFEEFYIEGITRETGDTYKVAVVQTLRKTDNASSKTVQENVYYKVKVQGSKVGIIEKAK